jgi:hypothetical protein
MLKASLEIKRSNDSTVHYELWYGGASDFLENDLEEV